jgi:hypothetical protein
MRKESSTLNIFEVSSKAQGITMPAQEQIMDRTSISLPKEQLGEIGKLVDAGEYPNVSEFVRDAVRSKLLARKQSQIVEQLPAQTEKVPACQ